MQHKIRINGCSLAGWLFGSSQSKSRGRHLISEASTLAGHKQHWSHQYLCNRQADQPEAPLSHRLHRRLCEFDRGINPVVVLSGNERKKLSSGENLLIRSGDIIELIPGHHFFKYVASLAVGDKNAQKRAFSSTDQREELTPKKLRQRREDKAISSRNSQQNNIAGNSEEAMRHFHVSCDKLPHTFRLLQVQGLPAWANTSCVSIEDVIQGDILVAILSNYMVDIDWLIPACPTLAKIPHVMVIHGEGDGTLEHMKWPAFTVKLPMIGSFNINPSFFKKFDYSDAVVRLVASVPGYHTGTNVRKWGHMKLRTILQECIFNKEFQNAPFVYQFSSLGSLDEKWMAELASSMSSGITEDKKPLGLGEPLIVWPTVEDVRCSLEGYAAGNAVPSPLKNVEKEFLKKYWAKWKASHAGRCRAMPHIKTYTRYSGQELAWFLLTSANLSKAAWGALQKSNSQLMIRSYELGVLFLPSVIQSNGHVFSCTNEYSKKQIGSKENDDVQKAKLVTLNWQGSKSSQSASEVTVLPVPYELPPQRYSSEDVPWSWDRRYNKKDVCGQVWPRRVQLYSSQD
ncbi:tyrosyl-DNA phosphodiesterase 1 isoform X4 [Tripterygium wilfordii]|uniref:tyrosyl-DNA phosphodiesterase 1 isoform X4 n=1 Tax=Tripterygium wilfordii TaxID=458696 RepID=UPI0018F82EED|nr:tyrosyl-DNA phosphodiesterase 1 isoform X4 [Tripterygium wilfordii]